MIRCVITCFALVLLCVPLCAAPPPNPMPPGSVVSRRLANGATVLVRRVPTAPLVAVDLWVQAGAADDGGTGAAHALEHMVFKGSWSNPSLRVDAAVEETGAVLSASTLADATHFWASVAPEHLAPVITNLANVVREPLLDPAAWEVERKVIAEEIARSKTDLVAETRRAVVAKLLGVNGGPVSGTLSAMNGLAPETLRAFQRKWYRPDRMTMVIVGNVDEDAALKAADTALSALPVPPSAAPEPARTASAPGPVEDFEEASGRLAMGIGYGVAAGESAALDIACVVLRSRLRAALAGTGADVEVSHPWQRAGMVIIIAEGGVTERETMASVLRRIPQALSESLTEGEVRAAIRSRQWGWWLENEAPVPQARTLGLAATLGNLQEATLAQEHMRMLTTLEVREAAKTAFSGQMPANP